MTALSMLHAPIFALLRYVARLMTAEEEETLAALLALAED